MRLFQLLVTVMIVISAGCNRVEEDPPAQPDAPDSTGQVEPNEEASAPSESAPPVVASMVDAYTLKTSDGTYQIHLLPVPEDFPLNELFELEIMVTSDGSALREVEVAADAAMPAHRHGMNTQPRSTQRDDGTFLIEGMMLHMPGSWEIYIDVTRDGLTERAQFDLELE